MRDLHTSVAVQRPFYWSLLHLWPDQLPGHSLAVVSGRDGLLPAPAVLRQLDGHPGAEVGARWDFDTVTGSEPLVSGCCCCVFCRRCPCLRLMSSDRYMLPRLQSQHCVFSDSAVGFTDLTRLTRAIPLFCAPNTTPKPTACSRQVLHHPEHNHADFLGDREWQREVVAGIGRLLDRAGSRPEESAAGSANGARLAAAVAVAGDAVAIAVQSDAKAPLEICGDQAAEAVPRRLSIAADASSVVLELAEGGCCSSAARKATAMFLT